LALTKLAAKEQREAWELATESAVSRRVDVETLIEIGRIEPAATGIDVDIAGGLKIVSPGQILIGIKWSTRSRRKRHSIAATSTGVIYLMSSR